MYQGIWRLKSCMEAKDWILLLVPILCNGVVVFLLQKIFERKQITRDIKAEYGRILRQKIDVSLKSYIKAVRFNNESNTNTSNEDLKLLQSYVDSILDVYYYYEENKNIFKSNVFEEHMQAISSLLSDLSKYKTDLIKTDLILTSIRERLMILKDECIKLHF